MLFSSTVISVNPLALKNAVVSTLANRISFILAGKCTFFALAGIDEPASVVYPSVIIKTLIFEVVYCVEFLANDKTVVIGAPL